LKSISDTSNLGRASTELEDNRKNVPSHMKKDTAKLVALLEVCVDVIHHVNSKQSVCGVFVSEIEGATEIGSTKINRFSLYRLSNHLAANLLGEPVNRHLRRYLPDRF
jgi:hypothetical protein